MLIWRAGTRAPASAAVTVLPAKPATNTVAVRLSDSGKAGAGGRGSRKVLGNESGIVRTPTVAHVQVPWSRKFAQVCGGARPIAVATDISSGFPCQCLIEVIDVFELALLVGF